MFKRLSTFRGTLMSTKASRKRQAQMDALLKLLRQCRAEQRALPTIGELAADLNTSRTTITNYIDELERTGQLTVRRNEQGRVIARTIVPADWSPQ